MRWFGVSLIIALSACGGESGGPAETTLPRASLLARRGHAMVYDVARQRVVLFGGIGPATAGAIATDQASAWEFDGTGWTQITSGGGGFTGRNSFAAAYDPSRSNVVVFGGRTGSAPDSPAFGETWTFSGVTLTRSATTGPSARSHVSGAYDASRQRVVVVGGVNPTTLANFTDQWEWDGQTWTQRVGVTVPTTNTFGGPLVADANGTLFLLLSRTPDRRVVVYSFVNGQWTAINTTTAPLTSGFAATRFPGGGILLFGGASDASVLGESWKFDGATWTRLNIAGPSARTGHAMAFDSNRNRVVLFGGESATQNFADSWEFDGTTWRQVP
jgi:hypothetical protein